MRSRHRSVQRCRASCATPTPGRAWELNCSIMTQRVDLQPRVSDDDWRRAGFRIGLRHRDQSVSHPAAAVDDVCGATRACAERTWMSFRSMRVRPGHRATGAVRRNLCPRSDRPQTDRAASNWSKRPGRLVTSDEAGQGRGAAQPVRVAAGDTGRPWHQQQPMYEYARKPVRRSGDAQEPSRLRGRQSRFASTMTRPGRSFGVTPTTIKLTTKSTR